jgi:hypothetical protein
MTTHVVVVVVVVVVAVVVVVVVVCCCCCCRCQKLLPTPSPRPPPQQSTPAPKSASASLRVQPPPFPSYPPAPPPPPPRHRPTRPKMFLSARSAGCSSRDTTLPPPLRAAGNIPNSVSMLSLVHATFLFGLRTSVFNEVSIHVVDGPELCRSGLFF